MITIIGCVSIFETTTVYVANDLSSKLTLIVHCRLKDNDIGMITVRTKSEIRWSFVPNIFNTTLF
ncbi:S-protein homolog 2 [Linum perenne]